MTTTAGRRLLVWLRDILSPYVPPGWMDDMGPGLGRRAEEHIAAIEAEAREEALLSHADEDAETIERERNKARAALLAELEAGVTELPGRWVDGDLVRGVELVEIAAVLDLIRKAGGEIAAQDDGGWSESFTAKLGLDEP